MSDLKRGDTVKLKSGSPDMIVCEISKIPMNTTGRIETVVTCKWYDKDINDYKQYDFYVEELDLCNI